MRDSESSLCDDKFENTQEFKNHIKEHINEIKEIDLDLLKMDMKSSSAIYVNMNHHMITHVQDLKESELNKTSGGSYDVSPEIKKQTWTRNTGVHQCPLCIEKPQQVKTSILT